MTLRSPSEFAPNASPEVRPIRSDILRRAICYLRPRKFEIAGIGCLAIVSALVGLVPPLLIRQLIDTGLDTYAIDRVRYAAIMLVGVYVIRGVVAIIESWLSVATGAHVICDIRMQMYRRMRDLPAAFYNTFDTGETNTRFGPDAVNAQAGIGRLLPDLLRSGVGLGVGIYIVYLLDMRLAIVLVAFLPLYWITTLGVAHRVSAVERENLQQMARLTSHLNSSLGPKGILITQGVRRQGLDLLEMARRARAVARNREILGFWGGVHRESLVSIGGLATAVIYSYGLILFINNQTTVGTVVACVAYFNRMTGPINTLADAGIRLSKALISFERIFGLLDRTRSAGRETPNSADDKVFEQISLDASAKLRDVVFVYKAGDTFSLDLPNIELKGPGLFVVSGPSGSGKTTFAYLMCGLSFPTSGVIEICGIDIKDLTRDQIAGLCDFVPAESTLFQGTILENISLGSHSITRTEVMNICRELGLDRDFSDFPNDYNVEISEFGSSLSMGQRQRVAIARALVSSCPIVILDEPFANLDAGSASMLVAAINRRSQGKLIIVICHHEPRGLRVNQYLKIRGSTMQCTIPKSRGSSRLEGR